ncbi:hypothetical protein ACIP3A_36170 [Streptomyces tricolor]|uniref:MmyB family transcriptional regulator n=1 Tax=Streptomyces tricolor TaxID=68277 RepID=UPI00381A15C6
MLRIIEGLHDQPAYVRNHRIGILAARPPVHPPARPPVRPSARPRSARRGRAAAGQHLPVVFRDPRATRMYPGWERVARDGVGVLRVEVAKNSPALRWAEEVAVKRFDARQRSRAVPMNQPPRFNRAR